MTLKQPQDDIFAPFEDFEQSGGGTQTFEGDDGTEDFFAEDSHEDEGSGSPVESQRQQQAPQQPQVDVNQVLALASQALASRQEPAPRQMSKEEIDAQLKVYKLQKDTFAKVFNDELEPEERMAAFQSILDGVSVHASTVAGLAARMVQHQLSQQVAPLQQTYEEQVNTRFVDATSQTFPGLAPYKQVLHQIVNQMKAEGYQTPMNGPAGVQMAMQEVMNRATAFIRSVNPQFDPAKAQAQQTQGSGMPAMSGPGAGTGAGGSGSGAGQRQAPKKAWQSIFS